MFLKLFILFITIPLIELILLIKIGTMIGVLWTIIIILVTGFWGAILAKQQGLGLIKRVKQELDSGNIPSNELFNGACILIGGFLLLTPGFLTDTLGFFLLIPLTREWIKKYVKYKIEKKWRNDTYLRY